MAKKRKDDVEEKRGDPFLQMFLTLSLILLAFFIMLNAISTRDGEKQKKALGSVLGTFGILPGSWASDDKKVHPNARNFMPLQGMDDGFERVKFEASRLVRMGKVSKDDVELTFDESTGELKVVLSDQIMFPTAESNLSPRMFALLDQLAELSKSAGGMTTVVGHTDDRAPSSGSNWGLSLERSSLIARYLEASGRLESGAVRAEGASHYAPRKANDTEEGRRSNRRVEIVMKLPPGA